MMLMLAIIAAVFFSAMFFMCCYRDKLEHEIIDKLFISVNTVFLFAWTYAGYELGWLKDGFMTLENISPYICTVISATVFLNEKVKSYAHAGIAFLSFGMFLAMFISPAHEAVFNYRTEVRFVHVAEAACHLIMALYGYYLILSDRVKLTLASYGKSLVFMFSSVLYGVFLNWCFHLGNFGMNMYGGYSIYFLDIFDSFAATLFAYLFGILLVLTLGFAVGMALDKFTRIKETAEK